MYRLALLSAISACTLINSDAKPLPESVTNPDHEFDIREVPYQYKIIVEWSPSSTSGSDRNRRLRAVQQSDSAGYMSLLPSNTNNPQINGNNEFNMYSVERLLKEHYGGRFFENVLASQIPELREFDSDVLMVHRLNAIGLDMIIVRDDDRAEAIRDRLKAMPSVKMVELDAPLPRDEPETEMAPESTPEANDAPAGPTRVVPTDPMFKRLWGLDSKADFDVNAPEMWAYVDQASYKNDPSASVLVAVLDTGSLLAHPDLSDQLWTNPGEIPGDGIDNDGNGYIDDVHGFNFVEYKQSPNDDHMHGSHCAGTIAGTGDNGEGVAGVWWNSKVMSLKILTGGGYGPYSASICALNYAVGMGAQVTSNSWGGYESSDSLKTAFKNAPMLHVVAAGNAKLNIDRDHEYPAVFAADVPQVVTIAALKSDGTLARFSNYGKKSVDFAAPGVDILSTCLNNTYCMASGTSMATPHVAGIAAALFARGSRMAWLEGLTNEEVGPYPDDLKLAMTSSVKKIASLEGKLKHAGTADALASVKALENIMHARIKKYKAGIQVFSTGQGLPYAEYLSKMDQGVSATESTCRHVSWSEWSSCSVECGVGVQTRIRLKYADPAVCDEDSAEPEFDTRGCVAQACGLKSGFSNWWTKFTDLLTGKPKDNDDDVEGSQEFLEVSGLH